MSKVMLRLDRIWQFFRLLNAAAASVLTDVPDIGMSGVIMWMRAALSEAAVWSGIIIALVNWESISLHMMIFCRFLSITSTANLVPNCPEPEVDWDVVNLGIDLRLWQW